MSKYIWSYVQLTEFYQSLVAGRVEPNAMYMGQDTYDQFIKFVTQTNLYKASSSIPQEPVYFHGALVTSDPKLPEGNIWFVGGVKILTLDNIPEEIPGAH